MNARRWVPAVAAAALGLLLVIASPAGADPKDPKTREAHPPHKVVRNATPTYESGYQPSQVAAAYGIAGLDCYGTATCGAGQTIAIVDAMDDPTIESDLAAFDAQFGLPCNDCFQKLTPQGPPAADGGWSLEITLDVEWAHALAPAARILLVEASSASITSLFSAVDSAVAAGATVVSMSFGTGEFFGETIFDSHFNVPGVTFFASSGDSGPGVLYPAASPFVTSVGGTTLPLDAAGNLTGAETAWSGSGGGVSAYETPPAFQAALGATGRSVPDVAWDADPYTGLAVYDSTPYQGTSGWFVVGGTSAGAPTWSALAAIVDARRTTPIGQSLNGALYTLPAGDFRDVTSPAPAGPGYDTATGLGSPLAGLLVPALAPAPTGATLSFASAAQTLTAGVASGPLAVRLSSAASGDTSVTFSSSSSAGGFATDPGGPWSPTVAVTIPAGATAAPSVYYRDTRAGSPTVTASASGLANATQVESVSAAAPASLTVSPTSASLTLGGTRAYKATGADAFGNAVAVSPAWSVSPALGTFAPTAGSSTTFTATSVGSGTVTATAAGLTATSSLTVTAAQTVRVSSVTYSSLALFGILQVTITVVNGNGTGVAGASVSATLNRNGAPYAVATNTTGSTGKTTLTSYFTPAGCYTITVTKVTATGYVWDGVTPPNSFCK